ncbi:MAG: CopG family transcriptional regulator [Verrucomicrobiota bacterium]
MRTTILLEDELAESLRRKARERNQSLSAFLAEAGRAALKSEALPVDDSFELVTYGEGGALQGVNLDRTGDLVVDEDRNQFGS